MERPGDFREGNLLTSDQLELLKQYSLTLLDDLEKEALPLTHVPDFHFYNIFGREDFYERFLGVLTQASGAFEKVNNW